VKARICPNEGNSSRYQGLGITLGLIMAVLLALGGCSQDSGPPAKPSAQRTRIETFTFFDLGRDAVLDAAARERLRRELGDEAVARRGLVNLEFVSPGWLKAHLPALDDLNRRLNRDFRERVEHDVLTLRYNYPGRSSPAFINVQLVFDLAMRRPLYFRILTNTAGAEILQVLKEKYGPPGGAGGVLIWERDRDRLLVVPRTDRLGRSEYLIGIYFVENIEALLVGKQGGPATGGEATSAF
jgi:hypothetical protein